MEKLESFGGEQPQQDRMEKTIFKPSYKELKQALEQAGSLEDVIALVEKEGGVMRSDGKLTTAEVLNKYIPDLKLAKEQGLPAESPAVQMLLRRITDNAGLRTRIMELIFGKK